jgi:CRP-like cAMP-binding protein
MLAQSREMNSVLGELAPADFALLRGRMTTIELRSGDFLHFRGDPIEEVIFPHSALVAMTLPSHGEAGTVVSWIGREGMVGGFAAAAAAPASCDAQVQVGGTAARIAASAFRYALDQSPSLRRTAARLDCAMVAQAQQIAACNATHSVEARISRCLLEILDRSGGNRVAMTQNAVAQLLGIRRTTVTLVAGRLETAGVLRCRRGSMQIIDRHGLERFCCDCYARSKIYAEQLQAPGEGVFVVGPQALTALKRYPN